MAEISFSRSTTVGAGQVPNLPSAAVAITKSDTDTYSGDGITVYVGVAGNVAIVPACGDRSTAVTFVGVPAGSVVPCRAYKVMSTNTTAASLVGIS